MGAEGSGSLEPSTPLHQPQPHSLLHSLASLTRRLKVGLLHHHPVLLECQLASKVEGTARQAWCQHLGGYRAALKTLGDYQAVKCGRNLGMYIFLRVGSWRGEAMLVMQPGLGSP